MATNTKKTQTKTTNSLKKPLANGEHIKKLVPRTGSDGSASLQLPSKDNVLVSLVGKQNRNHRKQKIIRDSFNMPAADYALIDLLKAIALKAGKQVKKSELLRAGLNALVAMKPADLEVALGALNSLKTRKPLKKS